jgi:hypothetical protein
MDEAWITAGNFDARDIVNPIFAAYDNEVYPNQVYILTTPNTAEQAESATTVLEKLAEEDGRKMEIIPKEAPSRPNKFKKQVSETFHDLNDMSVSLDITGRPSIYGTLLFQQAVKENLKTSHVYHLDYLIPPTSLSNELYPLIPQTALNLTDLMEEFVMGDTSD